MRFSLFLSISSLIFLQPFAFAENSLRNNGDVITISPIEREVTLIEDHANVLFQYKGFKVLVKFNDRSIVESMTDVRTGKRVTFTPELEEKSSAKSKKGRNY